MTKKTNIEEEMNETTKPDITKGSWMRQVRRSDFRAMHEGDQVNVLVNSFEELDSLRSQAYKMGRILDCKFRVNEMDGYARITCCGEPKRRADMNKTMF